MPAKSQAQQGLAALARQIQKGRIPAVNYPQAAKMARSMEPKALEEFARTPRKDLPKRKTMKTIKRSRRAPRTARNRMNRLTVKK
ncbi:MAG: DUF3008 family protein [Syntrophobacterales bacterium]|nr:DUF3008 family protein [Syntrophobacterales bacterium]